MTKTKYWLSILAISVVLVAGSLAVSPIAIADDDDDDEEVEASIEAELKLEKDGSDVKVEVEAEGLVSGTDFVVRAYTSTDCAAGTLLGGSAVGTDTSKSGDVDVSGTVSGVKVDDINSVSIRDTPSLGKIVVCFQDTT